MLILLLGGARSGKSALAERLADDLGLPVTYLATAVAGDDDDMSARVAAHRARRSPSWHTIEASTDLAEVVATVQGTALVDSLGTWLVAHHDFKADDAVLVAALVSRRGDTIVVSDEVGMGVHPETALGRLFRDRLGELNQAVAAVADRVILVVAGRGIDLTSPEQLLR